MKTLTLLLGAVLASYSLSGVPSSKCTKIVYPTDFASSAFNHVGSKVILETLSSASQLEYAIKSSIFTTSFEE